MIRLHLLLDETHLSLDIVNVLESRECGSVDSLIPREIDVLFEKPKLQAPHLHDLAGVGRFAACQQIEERRLAGAVTSDEPDLFAGVHLERDIAKDRVAAERF